LPAISVPSGFTNKGRPIGLHLAGPQKLDNKVLQAAYAFEKLANISKKMPELAGVSI
jgi:Asp-tRNA(Asn)/Glu-tRNA(Gln) amidotransferase A subunit family amidase